LAGVANGLILSGGHVADLSRDELQRLARLGAKARLEELRREEASIRRAFPDLFGRGAAGGAGRRGRKQMSAAARREVSARMTKYWAEWRKKKGKGK
jgi:hypothetical protein